MSILYLTLRYKNKYEYLLIMPILVCLSDSVRLSIHEKYEILEGAEKYFKRENVTQFFQADGGVF